jgi:hypothetical protein
LFLDDRRLTRFRRYDQNVTARHTWLKEASRSFWEAAELARRCQCPDFDPWLTSVAIDFDRQFRASVLYERMGAHSSRRDVASLTTSYLRFCLRHVARPVRLIDVGSVTAYGFAYCLAPGLTRRVRATRTPLPHSLAS